ncbi:MAG: hypothetical protein M3442_10320, partial [Chloroflexota bacterium]|nr:hypothetical protein [Chloroflexota bacterium]
AQPSGLSLDAGATRLFVADSETSAIRAIDLPGGGVSTLLGAGLFEFGDIDGPATLARLQHPLGVSSWPDDPQGPSLLIADTYNHRIKRLDLQTREVRTLIGAGAPGGFADGPGPSARFSEPGGLAIARGTLFVADTNNHRLRVVDLPGTAAESGRRPGEVRTLEIDLSRHAH